MLAFGNAWPESRVPIGSWQCIKIELRRIRQRKTHRAVPVGFQRQFKSGGLRLAVGLKQADAGALFAADRLIE